MSPTFQKSPFDENESDGRMQAGNHFDAFASSPFFLSI
jgi:hypothetical protein